MTTTSKIIHVAPGSELERLLADIADEPVVLDSCGTRYELNRLAAPADDIWANYDPERVDAALVASAGALAGVDVDELLADIAEQRAQDSSGRPG